MSDQKIVIRFGQSCEQLEGVIKRIVGFVPARYLLSLYDSVGLEANPRSAKVGQVTSDIQDTLRSSPDLFHFKSKGLLLGTSSYDSLQRNRYQLYFDDPASEGILDGGHNMLAIGLFILSKVLDEKAIRKLKLWEDMIEAWNENRDEIEELKDELDFLMPVELIVPADLQDEEMVETFRYSLLDICAARNNNAQLTQETKANQRGFYDEIRKRMPKKIADRVEWKSNEWESHDARPIKVRDLIALAWIPLNRLNEEEALPIDISVTPQNIYRNKGECSKLFDRLMEHPAVSKAHNGPQHEMHNESVASAFEVLADLPALYDKIYEDFPIAYNKNGGNFARNEIVKKFEKGKRGKNYVGTQPYTHYLEKKVTYRYPDGLIMPLVYGLKGIMEVKDGKVAWATDPFEFLDHHLQAIAASYRLVLDMARFDPQKLAKNQSSHEFAVGEFEKWLMKHQSK